MEKIIVPTVKNYGTKATVAQTLATIAQSFLLIGLGMELTVSTLVIGDLQSTSHSGFSLTHYEASWYGSILFIFHPFGSTMSGFLQERFGRKRCMILANVPSIIGWILLYYSNSVVMLYASTISMGMSIGFSEAPILSYVGEVTEPRLRGSMASIASMSSMMGMLLISILASMYHWRIVALLSIICPVACMCFVACIPESPMWLIAKGRNEDAEKALCWLRGWVEPNVINFEYHELIHYNKVSGALQGDGTSHKKTGILQQLALFKDPLVLRPWKFVMLFFFFSFFLCVIPCRPFLYMIFEKVGLHHNHDLILVFLSVLQIIGCILTIVTVNRFGKRSLTLMSVAINILSLFALGGYLIALNYNLISSTIWIPLIVISTIFFFGAYGISNMPWILLSEIYSNESRGVATGGTAACSYLLAFLMTKSYLSVELFLTLEYTIVLFAVIGLVGAFYLYYYMPETENKTFLEIEEFFALNKRVH